MSPASRYGSCQCLAGVQVNRQLETMYKDVIGVPHMVINEGQIRIGGAKDVADYVNVFQALLNEHRAEAEEARSLGPQKSRGDRVEALHAST